MLRIGAIFLAWTAAGLFYLTQDLIRSKIFFFRDPMPWCHYLLTWLSGVYLTAACTPLLLWLGRRFPIERRVWLRRILLHLSFSVVFAVLHVFVNSAILVSLGVFPAVMSYAETIGFLLIFGGLHGIIISYWTVLGIQITFRYYHQYQERRQQALRLELQASELQTGALHRGHGGTRARSPTIRRTCRRAPIRASPPSGGSGWPWATGPPGPPGSSGSCWPSARSPPALPTDAPLGRRPQPAGRGRTPPSGRLLRAPGRRLRRRLPSHGDRLQSVLLDGDRSLLLPDERLLHYAVYVLAGVAVGPTVWSGACWRRTAHWRVAGLSGCRSRCPRSS